MKLKQHLRTTSRGMRLDRLKNDFLSIPLCLPLLLLFIAGTPLYADVTTAGSVSHADPAAMPSSDNLSLGSQTGSTGSMAINSDNIIGNGDQVVSKNGYLGFNPNSTGTAVSMSGRWRNLEDLYVGYVGDGALHVSGGRVSMSSGYIGHSLGSTSTATVNSGLWDGSGYLYVGNHGKGTLNINGGTVDIYGSCIIGRYVGLGLTSAVHVTGGHLSHTNIFGSISKGSIYVGYEGNGSLVMSGGTVSNYKSYIARHTGSSGTATILGGLLDNRMQLYVGGGSLTTDGGGQGTLNIYGGTVQNTTGYIAYSSGATGMVTITDGLWDNSGNLDIGYLGKGTLNIDGGTVQNSAGFLWDTANVSAGLWNNSSTLRVSGKLNMTGGTVQNTDSYIYDTATVSGGLWDNSSTLRIGSSWYNARLIISGGTVQNTTGDIAYHTNGIGRATITTGLWDNSGDLNVGLAGTGTLNIDGGTVQNAAGFISLGSNSTSTASISAGLWDCSDTLHVGSSGHGTLNINGGTVQNTLGYIGYNPGSIGHVDITGGFWDNSSHLYVGRYGNGTLNIDGGTVQNVIGLIGHHAGSTSTATVSAGLWHSHQELIVGMTSGNGTLNIEGGTVSNGRGYIGHQSAATGTANVSAGLWDNEGEVYVGFLGSGTLNVTGGIIQNTIGYVGHSTGSSGTATVDGGQWNMSGDLSVGYDGTGTLNITGGTVQNKGGRIGYFSGEGTATITAGLWHNIYNLSVGDAANGTLNIDGGTVQNNYGFMGYYAGATSTVTVTSGLWNNNNDLRVARAGHATLNIQGGHVTVGSNLIFEHQPSGTSVLNFILSTPPVGTTGFIDVAGNVELAGELHVMLAAGHTLAHGDSFTLIDIANPLATVAGAFSNYAEGDILTTDVNGLLLRLTYQGGDGNDIVARNCYAEASTNRNFGSWAFTNGLAGCVNDHPNDDPDFDDMDNLLEYALGGNPLFDDAATILPVFGTHTKDGTNYLYLIYTRRLNPEECGLDYSVLSTTNLVSAPMTNETIEAGSIVIDTDFESVTNQISMEVEASQSMGLKVRLIE
jgi:T5SS/PEP-CTERM-associated repeat protein